MIQNRAVWGVLASAFLLGALSGWGDAQEVEGGSAGQSAEDQVAENQVAENQVAADQAEQPTDEALKHIKEYSIRFDNEESPLKLKTDAVMRWTNPIQQDQRGTVFFWMSEGRPQAVGCFFHYAPRGRERQIHEFHSLATKPFRVTYQGKEVWGPREGLSFTAFPKAGPPAASAQGRVVQMRRLARQFNVEMRAQNGNLTELRLLPSPAMVYQPNHSECTDGAIFLFVAGGTDPDTFLLIENRPVDGKPTWHYAFARFHYNELTAQLNGEDVWSANAIPRMASNYHGSAHYRDNIYISFRAL
ncbi:MAG: hypothetical protein MI861_22980 [Pirellulales bacterium]|nr:hypothetical protein [Pirellulales bacterium]